ncbi:helix-turn-helix transcriptional regulator [Megasphaera sp.]|uniref:helix-turn-helix domain-containing protein n=1 Tax=Megasphaera sp. TaxID=2023260 RepID=UPI001D1F7804|nr:helix-turn-helix transcriptional regulator [Megasphaera sp.]MBS6104475.1 helix-turn-helix transcriptional regulator [Megasphaera sp.]
MALDAKKLYLLMAKHCLNACSLAQKAGVSRATISLILNNGRQPNTDTVGKLAKALDVDVNALLKGGD